MLHYKMPLTWSNNSLAHNLDQFVTRYRFQSSPCYSVCEFPDYQYSANTPEELANLLVVGGFEDGTLQIGWQQNGLIERHESLSGLAARYRTLVQRRSLDIPPDRLSRLFAKSGRGLRPDVQTWWRNMFGETSRPWRLRRYVFARSMIRARRKVEEFLEFGSDADMFLFEMAWREL